MSDTGSIMMSLRNVGVRYSGVRSRLREFWALKDVTFDIHRGQTLGVIGRNGAGKSTLMKLLADILRPDRGELVRGNCSAQLLSLQVGFSRSLTGRENIVMSGILLGLGRQRVRQMMEEIVAFSELGEFVDRPVSTYSAGMRARLGFAIAHKTDPDVLLIDEVLGVGDRRFRRKTRDVIFERLESDQTVVIVSHQEETLRQHCDRLLWIEDGVTRMVGNTDEVLEAYSEFYKDHEKPRHRRERQTV